MSTLNCEALEDNKKEKNIRRRRKHRQEEEIKRKPIRLVSSLGEGKLLDRFQNAMGEKENKKKVRERSERERRFSKEKKEREVAKFKAELDALLEDNPDPIVKPKGPERTYVPKLSGTVKGKFEALEQKKKEQEETRMTKERQRRIEKDLREKKRIQIDLAKKKKEGLQVDEEEQNNLIKTSYSKIPGKLKNNFEEFDKRRKEHEKQKIELEREMKRAAEQRAVKEYYAMHKEEEDGVKIAETSVNVPGKLKTNFDDVLKVHEEQERKRVKEEKQKMLEEEKQQFRAAKLAAGSDENTSESSMTSQMSSTEKIKTTPSRLSSSFTKFDILEKQRIEEESVRIRERRKALLDEEQKLFEEAKRQASEMLSDDDETKTSEIKQSALPGHLGVSLTKFDLLTQEKLENERRRIHEERCKLLKEEQQNFKNQQLSKQHSNSSRSETTSCDSNGDSACEDTETEKGKKRKKRKKMQRTPSKLDRSKLKFDVLERQRMEEERLKIQRQRQKLLAEEKRLFEESKKQKEQDESDSEAEENTPITTPGRLDRSLTNFDITTQNKLEEERRRIKQERDRLLQEETKLMEKEKRKILEQEAEEFAKNQNLNSEKTKSGRKPKRLDKSFTEFDILEKMRKVQQEEELYQEKARKLEEEKKAFEEARRSMKNLEIDDDDITNNIRTTRDVLSPNKLSSSLTNFDLLEKERVEQQRLRAHEEKIKELEEEIKKFEEQKKELPADEVDDVTSGTRALLMSNREGPRPKKLSSTFTNFDVIERKRREEERERLQKEKARQLAEERNMFESNRRKSVDGSSNDDESSVGVIDTNSTQPLGHRSVKKMDVRRKIEAVMRAQEETERKRIEETKFTRMTVEQQEMFLAKQRQIEFLKQQLASAQTYESADDSYYESDDEEEEEDKGNHYYYYSDGEEEESEEEKSGTTNESLHDNHADELENGSIHSGSTTSNSSGTYSGAPYFVQTLKNLTVKEGDPVRFDANINANPHPKVIWYFKGRVIRNSADYQYINKGMQYSLYMNESFIDDEGEYACKAVNERGTASSKATLSVQECKDSEEE